MELLITSFIAGVLTILAPCVLPLLPVTLGGAVAEAGNRKRPLIIIASLSVSVFAFTLLLKGSTALINVSPTSWTYVSAVILAVFGLTLIFPITWAKIVLKLPGHNKPDSWMAEGYKHRGEWWADVLVGAALGPVFTTCSPTFFLILATVLPQSLGVGLLDLFAYVIGLALALLLVAYVGQKLVNKLEWAIDPNGWFRKALGILFVAVAIVIAVGWDKQLESAILRAGFFDVTTLEQKVRQSFENKQPVDQLTEQATSTPEKSTSAASPNVSQKIEGETNGGPYTEIVGPAGFINIAPFRLADFVGKKVILLDFIDYSCINCERTFPFMKDWWSKYKDQGLEIVAIHTPEFAFEKDAKNVAAAAKEFGLEFPIVLDNDYATWNAYHNEFWPHKYIIDIHGKVVYEHIGEGNDAQTEEEIVKQLTVRKSFLGESGAIVAPTSTMPTYTVQTASPETYFGAMRNEYFGNGTPGQTGDRAYSAPVIQDQNEFYLSGKWHIDNEYAENMEAGAKISYTFTAANAYLVAASRDSQPVTADILVDGVSVGKITISESKLYHLYADKAAGRHHLEIIFSKPGARAYTFTFG